MSIGSTDGSKKVTVAPPIIPSPFRLHIGGRERKEGWTIFNVQPGLMVDIVGDMRDLSQFPDSSCNDIYASHVLEHISYQDDLMNVLKELHRILMPSGKLMIAVPDLTILGQLVSAKDTPLGTRHLAMRIMFGGQVDEHDFHCVGFTLEILCDYLGKAGFTKATRVQSFGLFNDSSTYQIGNTPVSLNVVVET